MTGIYFSSWIPAQTTAIGMNGALARRRLTAALGPKPPASPARLESERKAEMACATPSAPHRLPHEVRSHPRSPAWVGHGRDYIATPIVRPVRQYYL